MKTREVLVRELVDAAMAMEVDTQEDLHELLNVKKRIWNLVRKRMDEMGMLHEKFGGASDEAHRIGHELPGGDPIPSPEDPRLRAAQEILESTTQRMEEILGPRFTIGSLQEKMGSLRNGLSGAMDFRIVARITELIRSKINSAVHSVEDELYAAAAEISSNEELQDTFVNELIEDAEREAVRRILGDDAADSLE